MYHSSMLCHSIFSDSQIKIEQPDTYPYATIQPAPEASVTFEDIFRAQQINRENGLMVEEEAKKAKQQKCNVCGKILSSAASYYVHLKQHSDNKPYHCTQCDASFCRKPYLAVHMRTHTGEKPFECDVCRKRFTQKSSLNTHKRSHTGLRPFACEVCLKRFSVKSYLVAHRWTHVSSNDIACPLCQILFNSKIEYAQHMRTHNTKGFDCDYCPRFFAKESYLIRHMTRVHSKVKPATK